MSRRLVRRSLRTTVLLALAGAGAAGAQPAGSPVAPSPVAGGAARVASAPRFADIRLTNGVKLHYAEQGMAGGDPVILLHGYTDSWASWRLVMPGLASSHRLFALDQRGHGRSSRPRDSYSLSILAADVLAFMDAKGIARATIVGHSLGSLVAQRVAQAAPHRVASLVLVAATSTTRHDHLREFAGAVRALPDKVPYEFARDFQQSTVHAPVPPDFMQEAIAASQNMPGRVWRALIDGFIEEPAIEPFARAPFPVLLVNGEKDTIFPRSEIGELQRIFPGATVVDYAETGHAPHWERPERFVRDLESFLSSTRTARR